MSAILKENIVLKYRYIFNKKGGYGNPGISIKKAINCMCRIADAMGANGNLD